MRLATCEAVTIRQPRTEIQYSAKEFSTPTEPARGATAELFATDIGSDGLFVLDLDTRAGTRMGSIPDPPGLGAGDSDVEAIAFDPDHGDFPAIEHFTN